MEDNIEILIFHMTWTIFRGTCHELRDLKQKLTSEMENVESKFNTASMENESLNGAGEFHILRRKCILELL